MFGLFTSYSPSNSSQFIFKVLADEHPIHGVGIELEEAPLPAGHAFFHGEKAPPPLEENVVLAIGNCGLYLGSFGVRVEDTVVVGKDKAHVLTSYPRRLEVV